MKKILVTGAAGFIGFHLVQKLLKEDDLEIIGLDNINNYYDINLKFDRLKETGIERKDIDYNKIVFSIKNKKYKFIKLDLADKKNIEKLLKTEKFDYVINLAAQAGVRHSLTNPDVYIQSNLIGFYNILENCKKNGIKHLIYASSSSVYGLNKKQPFSTEDKTDKPVSLYAATKKSNELMAHAYSYLFKIPTTGLRFFTVYGPWGRPDMAYYSFTEKILTGKQIDVYNNGVMERDFTYIDDVIHGIINLINRIVEQDIPQNKSIPYNIYNLGNSNKVKLMDLISLIEKYTNKSAILNFLPMQPGDVLSTYADINLSKKRFGYNPKTKIDDGIKKFIDWYFEYKRIGKS